MSSSKRKLRVGDRVVIPGGHGYHDIIGRVTHTTVPRYRSTLIMVLSPTTFHGHNGSVGDPTNKSWFVKPTTPAISRKTAERLLLEARLNGTP